MPQVFGSFEVNEFLKLQEILNNSDFNLSKIIRYHHYKSNRWDIEKSDDTVLMLPSENIEKSLKNYRSLLKANKITKGQLIDLRIKNKIILTNEKR